MRSTPTTRDPGKSNTRSSASIVAALVLQSLGCCLRSATLLTLQAQALEWCHALDVLRLVPRALAPSRLPNAMFTVEQRVVFHTVRTANPFGRGRLVLRLGGRRLALQCQGSSTALRVAPVRCQPAEQTDAQSQPARPGDSREARFEPARTDLTLDTHRIPFSSEHAKHLSYTVVGHGPRGKSAHLGHFVTHHPMGGRSTKIAGKLYSLSVTG